MITDEVLLDAWRTGDQSAGNDLLKRHFQALYRFFRNKAEDATDDLVQATMLASLRGRDQFRNSSSFRTYLFAIARHELFRYLRTKRRSPLVMDGETSSIWDIDPTPTQIQAARQEQQLLLSALRRIPVNLQIALELHYWESLTTAELAEVLQIPQGTVKSRLRRGREALDRELRALSAGYLTPDQLTSTLNDLAGWARSIRNDILGPSTDER